MSQPSEFEDRLSAVEQRQDSVEQWLAGIAADAAAARHLAAARDRDLADLSVAVRANRTAINALGVQTAARFDRLENRVDRLEGKVDSGFERMDATFVEIRGRLDRTAAGQQRIVDLLTVLIDRPAG